MISTADVDYRTNNASWKRAFRGGLVLHKLPGEPRQTHPLPRSLQMCSTLLTDRREQEELLCLGWLWRDSFPLLSPHLGAGERGQGLHSRSADRILQHANTPTLICFQHITSTALTAPVDSCSSSCYAVHTGTAEMQLF